VGAVHLALEEAIVLIGAHASVGNRIVVIAKSKAVVHVKHEVAISVHKVVTLRLLQVHKPLTVFLGGLFEVVGAWELDPGHWLGGVVGELPSEHGSKRGFGAGVATKKLISKCS